MPALIAKIKGRWQPKPGEPKITRGHVSRAINYALERKPGDERPRVLGGQGLEYKITDDESARRAGRDMEDLSDRAPMGTPGPRPNPLFHMILSWEDNPTDEHMVETGRGALKHIGTERAWGIFIRHRDTEHHHMHFVGSRIDPETGITFRSMQNWSKDRIKMLEFARGYELEHQRELERSPQREKSGNERKNTLDRSWLQHPDNFDEFAQARGLGRVNPKEAERIKEAHSNEKFLRDYQFDDKPERTHAPGREHENEHSNGFSIPNPIGNPLAKAVNRWADPGELSLQRQQGPAPEPVDVPEQKGKTRERGGGRERSIFDDGSSHGESGYGGD